MALLKFLLSTLIVLGLISSLPLGFWPLSLGVLACVAAFKYFGLLGTLSALVLSVPFIAAMLFVGLSSLRKKLITQNIFRVLRKSLPTISKTEQEALDSGSVWWEANIFRGYPNWKEFNDIKLPKLTNEEQSFVDVETDKLCSMLDDWKITTELCDLPKEAWDYLKNNGFMGLIIPKEYGGKEFSPYANSTVVQKIASRSLTAAVSVMVPNSLGPAELLLHYGTEEQKNYYLPKLADGREVPCFALTSPSAGSDATSISDTGVVCRGVYNNEECLGIRLNWNKRYITLAPIATVLGLAFKLYDPDNLLGDKEELGITVCLLPTNLPGVEVGNRHFPLNMTFMNGPTVGKDVFVPLDFIIGGKDMAGKGWMMLVECLAAGRGISLPALSAAGGKQCYLMTGAYARVRTQFNMPIGQFEGIKEVLAKIGGRAYRLEAMRQFTIAAIDGCGKPSVVTAIAKYHMTEMGRSLLSDSMDIHAGKGIILGPRNYLGRAYQGIPVSITVEGANILTRSMIIFGQGAIRCHPFIRKEIEAANCTDEKEGLGMFDKALLGHVGYVLRNTCRLIFHSFTAGLMIPVPSKNRKLKKYYKQVERMSIALSMVSEMALSTLGGKLKRLEILSAKLGDILSNIFMAASVLKYFDNHGNAEGEELFLQWCLEDSMHSVGKSIDSVLRNFPVPVLGSLLRFVIFPYGNPYKEPKDTLSVKIADTMQKNTDLRDRWAKYCYLNTSIDDPCGKVENAFRLALRVEPIISKLNKARRSGDIPKGIPIDQQINLARKANIIDEKEFTLLKEFEEAQLDAIAVDEFENLKNLVGREEQKSKQEDFA